MSEIIKLAEQVRWRWFLPLGMIVLTAALFTVANYEYSKPDCPWWRYDMPGDMQPFSLLAASALNGPAFVTFWQVVHWEGFEFVHLRFTAMWLPTLAVFWFVVGMIFDFKLRHPGQWIIQRRWIRIALFVTLILLSSVLLSAQIRWLHFRGMLQFPLVFRIIREFRRWTPNLVAVPRIAWMVTGIVYFSTKLWKTLTSQQPLTTND